MPEGREARDTACEYTIDIGHKHQAKADHKRQTMQEGTGIETTCQADEGTVGMEGCQQKQDIHHQGQDKTNNQRGTAD